MFSLSARSEAVAGLISLLVLLTLIELGLSYWENRKFYEKRDTFTNIYLTLLAFVLNLVVKTSTFFVLDYAWHFRLFEIKNAIAYWVILVSLKLLLDKVFRRSFRNH